MMITRRTLLIGCSAVVSAWLTTHLTPAYRQHGRILEVYNDVRGRTFDGVNLVNFHRPCEVRDCRFTNARGLFLVSRPLVWHLGERQDARFVSNVIIGATETASGWRVRA